MPLLDVLIIVQLHKKMEIHKLKAWGEATDFKLAYLLLLQFFICILESFWTYWFPPDRDDITSRALHIVPLSETEFSQHLCITWKTLMREALLSKSTSILYALVINTSPVHLLACRLQANVSSCKTLNNINNLTIQDFPATTRTMSMGL